MALAVTREPLPSSAPFCRGRQCLLGACSPEGPSHPLTPSFAASPLEALSSCAPCLAPHSPDPAHRCPAQGPAQSRCSVQPGDRKAGPTWPAPPPPARPLCPHSPEVAGVLWARTDLGGPESHLCSRPTGPAAMHLVSAPGPWAAGGLPGPARRGGRRRGGRPTLTTGKQTLCFCGGRSGARAAPHSQHGVNYLPNGSRETSPKRAGPGGGTEADVRLPQQGLAGAPRPSQGTLGPGLLSSHLELGAPKATGRQDCRTWGPLQLHPNSPAALFQREGILSGEASELPPSPITSFCRRPGAGMRLDPSHIAG